MAEAFFTDEQFDWWDEEELTPEEAAPAPEARPRRRGPPRTFAGDLSRLRARAARNPLRSLAVFALALAVLVAVAVRPFSGDDRRAAPASAAPRSAPPSLTPDIAPPAALREGDRGGRVRDLQIALCVLGAQRSPPDGSFGATTTAAVQTFQGTRSLVVDGIAGEDTKAALRQAIAERAQEDGEVASAGLTAAVAEGRLDEQAAADARTILAEAIAAIGALQPGRAAVLGLVIDDVAAVADEFGPKQTPALFAQIRANTTSLADEAPDIAGTDVADGSGVVYRFFPQHGYRFHPLANFAKLNTLAGRKDEEAAVTLANALVARGVRKEKALTWPYRFSSGGPDVWESGFAQAVGAQALARTSDLAGDRSLLDAAGASFRAIPRGLTLHVGGGTWIQEYGFSPMAVLNAQLQTIVSLSEYAERAGDEQAKAYVAGLSKTTQKLMGDFDTGCWSRYSLDGNPATTGYHTYHVKLLERLGRSTGDPFWQETGRRWRGYLDASGSQACVRG
jgi:hypothetical protein